MRSLLALTIAAFLAAPARAQDEGPPPVVLRGVVHVGDGEALPDGAVVVRGKRVVAVGTWADVAGRLGPDARVVAVPGAEVTPGLIEAMSAAGLATPGSWAEQEVEVVPHLRVLDEVDLHAPVWRRLAERGVTTVCVAASPESVIGGKATIVRTGGPARGRVVETEGAVKATLGPEAWRRGARNRGPWGTIDHLTRRPTTRMGGVWVFRDAFARARAGTLEGPAGATLAEVLEGDRPLRIQARTRGDIETALRLAEEAGVSFVLEEATEVRHVLDLVKARGVAVIFGPVFDRPRGWRAFTGEGNDPALATPAMLHAAGVRFCLTAADREDEDDLRAQAMMAVRYGLDPAAALRAVTLAPAMILGLERTGLLAPERDADVVVWSGPPLEPTSRPLLVLVQGQPVVDRIPDLPERTVAPAQPGPPQRF
ncbi:MAG: amidohydrolase family protein [Planctomycetes bacterium]|nr:amidohydrolase family protein [Planctomycetota bacterium]